MHRCINRIVFFRPVQVVLEETDVSARLILEFSSASYLLGSSMSKLAYLTKNVIVKVQYFHDGYQFTIQLIGLIHLS
jgi:hypothetical protein